MLTVAAVADRYWVAGDGSDAKWSNSANWATSENGSPGASEPNASESTDDIYFCPYKNGATVFDKLGKSPGNVQVGTQDDRYFVWSATASTNGLDATGKELQICQNISNSDRTPAKLQIDSGTYKFGEVSVACIANGTAELLLKGGTLDCTSGEYMSIGGCSNTTATVHIKGGNLSVKGFLLGGRVKHKNLCEADNAVARMILDGGTLSISASCAIGNTVGEGSVSEMIVNDGATVNCNYENFHLAESGPGSLIMNGGTFTMKDSSSNGLSFGRVKNGKDVATLVLNGGVLTTSKIRLDYVQSGSRIVFNGGTIKPTRSTSSFLDANTNLTCEVQEGGLVVDTAGKDIAIKHPLTGSGPLIKKGEGTLTVSDATPFTSVIVQGGTAVVGGTTYEAPPEDAIDASAGGYLGEVVIHREELEGWLKDPDFRDVAKYGAAGTAMMEQPKPVVVAVNGVSKTYINLETGKTYNDEIAGTSFSFTTEDLAPRTLQIIAPDNDPVANVRDIGSWPLLGGRKMKQGVILRGGNLDNFLKVTAEQRAASFLTSFGLKTEIELRKDGLDLPSGYKKNGKIVAESFAADNCAFVNCGIAYGTNSGSHTQISSDDDGNFTNSIRKVFATLGTPGNLPSYFHCRIGTDRTGIVALLLLSMMGADEEVLYRDYLMSNFANIESARDTEVPETFIRYLMDGNCNDGKYVYDTKDAQYGVSLASRARQYLEMCGVTEEQLGVITEALSGETPAQVLARVNACGQDVVAEMKGAIDALDGLGEGEKSAAKSKVDALVESAGGNAADVRDWINEKTCGDYGALVSYDYIVASYALATENLITDESEVEVGTFEQVAGGFAVSVTINGDDIESARVRAAGVIQSATSLVGGEFAPLDAKRVVVEDDKVTIVKDAAAGSEFFKIVIRKDSAE